MIHFDHFHPELRAIGDVARETGLTPRAIRYYEERGLLRPAVRVKGADRLFDQSDLERLRKIKQLREVIGFSLAEIAELLETDDLRKQLRTQFAETTDSTERLRMVRQAIALAERRLALIDSKLAQLQGLQAEERERISRLRALLPEDLATEHPPAPSKTLTPPGGMMPHAPRE